jgi:hypothetical protein
MLHGVSSVFYLIESLLGIVLVWKLPAESGVAVERGAGRVAGRTAG